MFKILVADDEQFIRKGIITILRRNITEPLEIFEAKNGIEAIEQVENERPHLIITDINMPGLDGLQFIRDIKEKHINTDILLLSGYSTFEYAQQAISLGVKEYITKPIDKDEFVALINKYIHKITQEKQKAFTEHEQKKESYRIIEGVKEDFLVAFLSSVSVEESSHYIKQLKELKVEFKPQWYTCVVFQYELTPENHDYIDFVVKNILDEYLQNNLPGFLLNANYNAGRTISIFETNQEGFSSPAKKSLIRNTASTVANITKIRVFAGVGATALGFEHLQRVFRQALEALEYKIFDAGDNVCVHEEITSGEMIALPRKILLGNDLEVRTRLNHIFRQGQTKEVLTSLRQFYEQVLSHLSKRIPQKEQNDYKPFESFWTLDELKREVKYQLDKLHHISADSAINVKLMKEILAFIDENISDDLDLTIVAEKFNRSPSYISTMFKRFDSDGFNAYVTEKRISKAKKLLLDSHISIQDIAEACGFRNAKYFSSVFKKKEGLSPREYREIS